MRNIKLTIAYDGTNYKGWQLQKNGRTLQGELEKAIERAFGKKCRLYGSGRTDSGVHAKGQIAHFKTAGKLPVKKIPIVLTSLLPQDIQVVRAEEVPFDFHSQFDAKTKHYEYRIFCRKTRDPFIERYAYRWAYKLNLSLMKKEIAALIGEHDFKSFQAADKSARGSVRKIYSARVTKRKQFIIIDIVGNGFLYNMVRNITGTLIEIGRGYFPPGSMKKILKMKDRTTAGPTVPAKGLFLVEVKY
ncbi:MAG: tRNA pseudouridine(38-40) synthase TruA [Candidatus Omnitrophica bacterium]|nr:tRNA pseudouridine(38-40) synthase TruA [Candidatus Omnitrophota bacterium]